MISRFVPTILVTVLMWACATPAPVPASAPPAAAPDRSIHAPPSEEMTSEATSEEITSEPDEEIDGDTIDDEPEAEPPSSPPSVPVPEPASPAPHPLDGLSDQELKAKVASDLASLGSISVGRPNVGGLVNGVQLPEGTCWERIDPAHEWGTQETIDYLTRAINSVCERFSGEPIQVGHISARRGGPLRPHKSHQSGRDVDVSYYTLQPGRWFARASAKTLDVARTWALVRALVKETDVEMILIDHSLQRLLREYAHSIGEDDEWIRLLFEGEAGKKRAVIHHAKGHATHMHIRFFNPIAEETATRLSAFLPKPKAVKVAGSTSYVMHRARSGDTLGSLARRYGTTVEAIRAANGLRDNRIRAKKTYRIPRVDPHAKGRSKTKRKSK